MCLQLHILEHLLYLIGFFEGGVFLFLATTAIWTNYSKVLLVSLQLLLARKNVISTF